MDKNEKFDANIYNADYKKANYDRFLVTVPKGRQEVWKAAAAAEGKSLNAFIKDVIEAYIASDVLEAYLNVKKE